MEHQFQELINKIDELLVSSTISNKEKDKLKKAKTYLLSPDDIDWIKGITLLGRVIKGANLLYHIFDSLWDWLHNLF